VEEQEFESSDEQELEQ